MARARTDVAVEGCLEPVEAAERAAPSLVRDFSAVDEKVRAMFRARRGL